MKYAGFLVPNMNAVALKLACLLLASVAACQDDESTKAARDGGTPAATARLAPTSASVGGAPSRATGTATFTQMGAFATIQIGISGASDGKHGLHIHANGSCEDTTTDGGTTPAGAAGGHWNPAGAVHGVIGATPRHAGDLGNIEVVGGQGSLLINTNELKVSDLVGKTVVLHAGEDDLKTDPAGGSGARIACGMILASR